MDDASTDGTPAILRKEFSQWPVIRLPRNRGQSHARNIGARHAKGEYIIFLDGDIEMRPDMIERLEKALDEDRGVSIAYCHYNRVGSRNDDVRSQPWDPDRLKQVNYISMISMIRRKDMPMPPMDEELRRYEDWDLWLRMMKVEKRGVLVDETLFTAYYQSTDLSGNGESADWRYIVEKKHGLV